MAERSSEAKSVVFVISRHRPTSRRRWKLQMVYWRRQTSAVRTGC